MTYQEYLDLAIVGVSGVMIFSVATVGVCYLPWRDEELVMTEKALSGLYRHIKERLGM